MPFSLDTGDTFGSGDAEVNGGMGEASIAEAVCPVDEANCTIPMGKSALEGANCWNNFNAGDPDFKDGFVEASIAEKVGAVGEANGSIPLGKTALVPANCSNQEAESTVEDDIEDSISASFIRF